MRRGLDRAADVCGVDVEEFPRRHRIERELEPDTAIDFLRRSTWRRALPDL